MRPHVLVPLVVAGVLAVAVAVFLAVRAASDGGAGAGMAATLSLPVPGTADVAIGPDGRAVAVWTAREDGRVVVRSADRAPRGEWSPPVTIAGPRAWTVIGLDVVAGGGGEVVTWEYRSGQSSVPMAVRRAGRAWSEPQAVAPVMTDLHVIGSAVGPGDAAVVATVPSLGRAGGLTAVRWTGTAWRGPERPGTWAPGAWTLSAAVAPDGTAYLALPSGTVLRGDDAGWEDAGRLPARPRRLTGTALAVDGEGRLIVAWTRITAEGDSAILAAALTGDSWSEPRELDRAGRAQGFVAPVAQAAEGGVIVAWARWAEGGQAAVVAASRVPEGGAPTAPTIVDEFPLPDPPAGVRYTPSGPPIRLVQGTGTTPVLTWDRLLAREPDRTAQIVVARGDPSGDWSAPREVAGPVTGWPLAAGTPEAGTTVAWLEYTPPHGAPMSIRAADDPD